MTTAVTVPAAPPLARVPNVELLHTGTWALRTGTVTFTTDDLTAAVAALGCPAVRRPVLKLGHIDPRFNGAQFDGEPAVGYIANLGVADNGRTLVGDYAGIPGWLGDVIASAYPDRSVEGEYDFRCQMGHTHPFVLHAVALLGVTRPGVGTLGSLTDVAELFGVDMIGASPRSDGVAVTVTTTTGGDPMPNPAPLKVAATVTTEDVMRAFYSSDTGRGWDIWVEQLQLDPLQVIYVDDSTGARYRSAVTVSAGEGVDGVAFGDPVPVVIRYEDAARVSAQAPGGAVIRYASRAESRPAATRTGPERGTTNGHSEGNPTVTCHTDQQLRNALNLPDDAPGEAVTAAVEQLLLHAPPDPREPFLPLPLPEGVVSIDAVQLEELKVAAARGDEARRRQEHDEREATVTAAVADGRIAPARREHWIRHLEADPAAVTVLASLAPGLIPVGPPAGYGDDPTEMDPLYTALYGKDR